MVISVNEGDVFRDEGLMFYRRCLQAGVPVQARMVMGTLHASDISWHIVPDLALSSAQSLADFAANGQALQRLSMPQPIPADFSIAEAVQRLSMAATARQAKL